MKTATQKNQFPESVFQFMLKRLGLVDDGSHLIPLDKARLILASWPEDHFRKVLAAAHDLGLIRLEFEEGGLISKFVRLPG